MGLSPNFASAIMGGYQNSQDRQLAQAAQLAQQVLAQNQFDAQQAQNATQNDQWQKQFQLGADQFKDTLAQRADALKAKVQSDADKLALQQAKMKANFEVAGARNESAEYRTELKSLVDKASSPAELDSFLQEFHRKHSIGAGTGLDAQAQSAQAAPNLGLMSQPVQANLPATLPAQQSSPMAAMMMPATPTPQPSVPPAPSVAPQQPTNPVAALSQLFGPKQGLSTQPFADVAAKRKDQELAQGRLTVSQQNADTAEGRADAYGKQVDANVKKIQTLLPGWQGELDAKTRLTVQQIAESKARVQNYAAGQRIAAETLALKKQAQAFDQAHPSGTPQSDPGAALKQLRITTDSVSRAQNSLGDIKGEVADIDAKLANAQIDQANAPSDTERQNADVLIKQLTTQRGNWLIRQKQVESNLAEMKGIQDYYKNAGRPNVTLPTFPGMKTPVSNGFGNLRIVPKKK